MESRMPPARRLKPETRERLLAAAGALFVRDGYLEVTVAQICARAGVSNGSFFHFFKTKPQLAEALIADIARCYQGEVLSRLLLPARSPEQAIAAVLHAHLRWVASDQIRAGLWFGLRPVLHLLGTGRSDGSPVGGAVDVVRAWAQPLIASREIRSLPPEVIAAHVFGSVSALGVFGCDESAVAQEGTEVARAMATAAWGVLRTRARGSHHAHDVRDREPGLL